ncbi:cofactor-independent phosphoglycerate mutase [Alkalibacter rhizosphaerae]|uniref:Cofactor-independent phosphoglycerate mutase n=1 Tax=Alkalibacter rhizosphaerae TaxID=2815577 RepID=A0A974XIH9_9FIRM|nr:cofactor-independent phosphoglycerate mutase [Alkalibacter rhizosphaerae]QSX08988.1 cofactor-independent phosphoglycerate mutase [Alkalibacter rhizosphaerae]
MKLVTILVDGMADHKIPALGNKTPLEVALIPTIDHLAKHGEIGTVDTIPEGMSPGSDIANLSVMGYDPKRYHRGRSPLEAASMGVAMEETDVSFRCNLVTLTTEADYASRTILDHSAGDITTEEAAALVSEIKKKLDQEDLHFFPGFSYRHLILWNHGPEGYDLTPPHDILGQNIANHLPKGPSGKRLLSLMESSVAILENHPVNLERIKRGLRPANSIWIWGEGKKPSLDPIHEKYGVKGAVISAVDLIQGIGVLTGMEIIKVEGATGTIHTNFDGKCLAAIHALESGNDFVYVHLEAPDECGHQGDLDGKIRSIELIDEKIVKPIYQHLEKKGEPYRILILPDHRTPVALRTHTADPVPYVLYDSQQTINNDTHAFTEDAGSLGSHFPSGVALADHFFSPRT